MTELLVLSGIFFLTLVNFLRYRDVLYPPVLQGGLWFSILAIYVASEGFLIPLSGRMYLIILNGVFTFTLGSYISTYRYRVTKAPLTTRELKANDTVLMIMLLAAIVGLPFYLRAAYAIGSTALTSNFFIAVRSSFSSGEHGETFGALSYLVTLSFVSVGLHLLAKHKRRGRMRLGASIAVASIYAIFTTGRTFLVLLFAMILGILMIRRKMSIGTGLAILILITLLSFIGMGFVLQKGVAPSGDIVENMLSLWDSFRTYLLGGIAALDLYMDTNISFEYGANTFRTVLAVMDRLGIPTYVPPLIKDFQYVPRATNVYTMYQPYYTDFGMYGVVMIQFFLGMVYGAIYKKANRGNGLFVIVYGVSLYPLIMQSFVDQYFSLLSTWIQYGTIMVIYFYLARVVEQREERLREGGAVMKRVRMQNGRRLYCAGR